MDTPQSNKPSLSSINNTNNKLINPSSSSSNSPAFQDSPVFNYISNLSPIQPVKADSGAQGFPGLASPPLLFTSPRINSLQSLLNRKLLSSGSLDSPQDNNKCDQNDGDPEKSVKVGPECKNLLHSKEQSTSSVKNLELVAQCSPGCIDNFLSDPDANSSGKRQSDDTSQFPRDGSLQKREGESGKKVNVYGSTPLNVKKGSHAKSRISIKVVKNEARHLIPASEVLGSIPRLLTENAFEVCQNGESSNEASHLERGTLRRCLFEENQNKISYDSDFRNFSDNLARMEEPTNLSYTGRPTSSETNDRPKPATGSCASVTGRYPVASSKPLGIGLHLNSVIYPRSLHCSKGSQQSSSTALEGKSLVVLTSNHADGDVNATTVGKVSAISEESRQSKLNSISTSLEAKPSDIEHIYSPVLSKPDARTAIISVKRKSSPQITECNELPYQMSPKKKRKKTSNTSDNDLPKRCNCKKTKCLKLYCDCFAAGLYCLETCACQGCCNRPENEDIVQETRQLIETRNPLAFAPKIVQPVTDSPVINKEIQNISTPSSARHTRGCNCKKSMCLKKYCECYQANVGCSDGCRCEGCKNVFGIREDYRLLKGLMVRNAADEMSEAIVNRKHEITSVGSNFGDNRVHISPNLTPATPALQCSDLRKNALKSPPPFMTFLETPHSQNDVSLSDENFLACPENSQSYNMPFGKSTDCIDESTSSSAIIANSVATFMGPPSSSKTMNSGNTLQSKLLHDSVVPPMSSSLRWRSSPMTPVTQLVELEDFDSGSKKSVMTEDDTPDVLKDSSTPAKSVKVSSPNKKRISAPHNPLDSSEFSRNDSSLQNPGSLKVCHRFVLRSLPTFPSSTPFSKEQ